jgi:XTP/dITP diphosphohydrolase/tetrapyrrole methylase family protein/MazG family protein/ATP diphosphatase
VTDERLSAALVELDQITRRLRVECPWDREQDERSIVPHTVEEAYELADAAHAGDDAKLVDELGDVLFQVYFLSLLLEERGQGDLATVADHCRTKLIRRHPHVFGERAAATADDVVRNWTEIKREDEQGGDVFGDIPETHPSTIQAAKVQRRAEGAGLETERNAGEALWDIQKSCESFFATPGWREEEVFERVGALLYDAVAAARALGVDPEVGLRQYANAVRRDIEETG